MKKIIVTLGLIFTLLHLSYGANELIGLVDKSTGRGIPDARTVFVEKLNPSMTNVTISGTFSYLGHNNLHEVLEGWSGLDGRFVGEGQVGSITSNMIANGSITTNKLASGFIFPSASIGVGSIISTHILNGTVLNEDVASGIIDYRLFSTQPPASGEYTLSFSNRVMQWLSIETNIGVWATDGLLNHGTPTAAILEVDTEWLMGQGFMMSYDPMYSDYTYTTNNQEIYIESYTGTNNTVIIPPYMKGLPVTRIQSEAFLNNTNITSVTISDNVVHILQGAFQGCSSLVNIDIGRRVDYIWDYAFSGCTSLQTITIPDGVQYFSESVFGGCTNLSSITFGTGVLTINDWVFDGCSNLTNALFKGNPPYLNSHAFNNSSSGMIVYYDILKSGWTDTFGGKPAVAFNLGGMSNAIATIMHTFNGYQTVSIASNATSIDVVYPFVISTAPSSVMTSVMMPSSEDLFISSSVDATSVTNLLGFTVFLSAPTPNDGYKLVYSLGK